MSWSLDVAARTLWQEVRGEPLEGQTAVAHVIKNRLLDGRWGNNLATVCLWKAQFSGWYMPHDPNFSGACNLKDDDAALLKLQSLMQTVLGDVNDPTNGATHYYAEYIAAPAWTVGATPCGKFGRQFFFKGIK
jgi:N-acetylmuramoyl-L-alanine amidase